MTNSKKIGFISCAGICTLAFLGYQTFGLKSNLNEPAKVAKVDGQSANVEASQQLAVPAATKAKHSITVEKPAATTAQLVTTDNASSPQSGKKHYDDQWCSARKELSESDYNFAQTQLQDWNELQGKARARSPGSSHVNELTHPNNNFIEPYEALPFEQLQSQALKGDKWAMVAFIQHSRANMSVKNEVAKKLLVQGASYYALEALVMNSLVAAQTSLRRDDGTQAAVDLVVEALAYVYWGIEHYSDGGLNPFNAITSREPFITKLPIEQVLTQSEKQINSRLTELTNKIQIEREKAGIEIPVAPKAVQKWFEQNVAAREHISKEQMDLLRSLDIPSNNQIKITPCVDKYLADLREKMQ